MCVDESRRLLPKPYRQGLACDKTASFFEFSLCLSRACLGKMFVFYI